MFKNPFWLLLLAMSVSTAACFAPHKYFETVPMDSGESLTFSVPDSVLLELSSQILQMHDFRLAAPRRDKEGAIILTGEKISTEILKQKPLSDGAVRIRIQPLGEQESRMVFTWHSFYRKNLQQRIIEDQKVNTERFWELLTMRVNGVGSAQGEESRFRVGGLHHRFK